MTLTRRVIACLDVRDGRVVKGRRFVALRDVGDPVALAIRYEDEGADEIAFLDVTATAEGRATLLDLVRRTAERLYIPLTVGGGIRSVADVDAALRAGADKVAINSAAVRDPSLLRAGAERFGRQCIVASIDARRDGDAWLVHVSGGRDATALDAVAWSRECAERGAGEILLTSIDRDGVRAGFDLDLTDRVARSVTVPVIASGGAGGAADVTEVLTRTPAAGALVAGILHDGVTTVAAIKDALRSAAVPVREAAA